MASKRFGTQLKELAASIDKNERLTPTEFIARFKDMRSGKKPVNSESITEALKNPRFVAKVNKSYRRSESGRVVLYFRKGEPMAMTVERLDTLLRTVKKAQDGVRKYWNSRKKS